MAYWPGLESGNSKEYAVSGKIRRRLDRLLQAVAQSWPDFELAQHRDADYEEYDAQVKVSIGAGKRRDPRSLTAYVWYEPDEDDAETYLMAGWYAKRTRIARDLAKDAARRRELRAPGMRLPAIDERQWYVRAFPLSQVEAQPSEGQLKSIMEFIRETFQTIEHSGVLDSVLKSSRESG